MRNKWLQNGKSTNLGIISNKNVTKLSCRWWCYLGLCVVLKTNKTLKNFTFTDF